MVNDTPAEAEDVQHAAKAQVNEELVKVLKILLAEAEAGNTQGMGFIKIVRPSVFSVFVVGSYPLEINAGAALLMNGCVMQWHAQLQASIAAQQKVGLQRATMADLSKLPDVPSRRRS